MHNLAKLAFCLAASVTAAAACAGETSTLQAAAKHLGAENVKALEFTGTGSWALLGHAYAAGQPWVPYALTSYVMNIDYETATAHVQFTRAAPQAEDKALAPMDYRMGMYTFFGPRAEQFVSGKAAWNISASGTVGPQPGAVAERAAEIWATPQGFVKAALANNASVREADGGTVVSFVMEGTRRFEGMLNAKNEVARVRTWIANPVLGDMPVETTFTDYRDFSGIRFPSRIVRTAGGHPVLDIAVSGVKASAAVPAEIPERVRTFTPAPVRVEEELIAPGVYYLRGGGYHSLAIEQASHIVIVEAPLNEERSLAVIAKAKSLIPGKPIRFVVNTHVHFDHSGGLRSYVSEGASVVTHASNQAFYEEAWKAPHTLAPDELSKSGKMPVFVAVQDTYVLADDRRPIEIHLIKDSGHSAGMLMAYLPIEKVLYEADTYSPTAAGVPDLRYERQWAANLLMNIQRLGLPVDKIAAGHGPRIATVADLEAAVRAAN